MRKRLLNSNGFSMMEAMAASAILAITVFASYVIYSQQSQQLVGVRAAEAESQVEGEVKSFLMYRVSQYYLWASQQNLSAAKMYACQNNKFVTAYGYPTNNRLQDIFFNGTGGPMVTGSETALNILSSVNTVKNFHPASIPNTQLPEFTNFPQLTAAYNRCKASQTMDVSPNFSNGSSLYFCLVLNNAGSAGYNNFLSMQPVLVEAMFTPLDITTNTQVACKNYAAYATTVAPPNVAPANRIVRNLYYTFYWKQTGATGEGEARNIYNSKSGMFAMAGIQ
jgi:hypothetical protein